MADVTNPIASVEILPVTATAPLRVPLFRNLWLAAVVSFTGSWMQQVGAAWLMTMLTKSPFIIALVPAAMALPVFLVVLPAGALADMVDRRKLLLFSQIWMAIAAAALGWCELKDLCTPWTLLGFTFLLGLGAVLNDPAWQAITPEVVPPHLLQPAVALNSAGFNIARAVGPALAGFVIAGFGSGWAFLINAASFLGVIIVLYLWKSPPHPAPEPMSKMMDSVREGLRYMRETPSVRSVLVRTGLFSLFAAAFWAMLPLVARPHGSVGLGLMVGCFGLGALAGAGVLPRLRKKISTDGVVAASSLLFAAVVFGYGRIGPFALLCAVMFAGGVAWIGMLTSLNVSAQLMAPRQLRARALSMYLLVLQGGLAGGSAVWGAVAEYWTPQIALTVASIGLAAGLLTLGRHSLEASTNGG